jgi:3-carboxy-cis,cis-muconate cycloisomerase
MTELFGPVLARGGAAAAVADQGWLQAMLDAEAALARAEAAVGVIPAAHAEAIAGACRAERFDAAAIGEAAAAGAGNPAEALVRALREAVGGEAAGSVHRGATSQDIVDTAAMLVAQRALKPLRADLGAAADAAARLAREHRDTPMAGRTLLQQAVPITFGYKAAVWLAGLDAAAARLAALPLAAQLGGAAGTLAALGDDGVAVLEAFARELGLAVPVVPWHAERTRIAELAGALGAAAGACGKVARDVTLLAQTEVAEVRERRGGGSSTMPHKRNPIASVCASACAAQAPGLVATLLAAMAGEHERAAGAWHAEWRPLAELLRSTGSAAAWLRDALDGLEVDSKRMRVNLELTGGLLMAERAAAELGREEVERAIASGRPFAEVVSAELLDPEGYLGSAGEFVDRALRAHEQR